MKNMKQVYLPLLIIELICQIHTVAFGQSINVCYGLKDGYVCPEEPVTPDAALLNYFTAQYASNPCFGQLEFDNFPGLTKCNGTAIPQNALFIHQILFPVTAGSVGAASLQFRAKAAPTGQTSSDFITFFEGATYITGASLIQLIEAGGTWNPNQDATFTLDLNNLPTVFSVNSIIQYLYDGDLDVVIGNETGVDWMCLDAVSDTCYCAQPSFTNLYLRGPGGPSIPIQCETSYENIGCPDPGYGFNLTGFFDCAGDSCFSQPEVYWNLVGPGGSSIGFGSAPGPYFGINLLPAYFLQPGIYTMELSGFCNFDTCSCEFQFIVECPNQCPCDINDLQADVNQGFNHVLLPRQCQACFTPKALSECDSVYWYNGDPNGTPIGSSIGNNSFCYTFSSSGIYTVFMEVTRKKPDGSNCESFRKSQTVRISCGISPLCDNSVYSNPTFSENPLAGGLYSGGSSFGWNGLLGEPLVTEGKEGSSDGWTIQLWGNLDTSAVLTQFDAICLERDTGTITLRTEKPKRKPREIIGAVGVENLKFHIFQGDNFDPDNCNGIDCYELASIPISALPLDEWYEVQIPYDLRGKMAMDTCSGGHGVLVRPAIFVSNIFGSNQGGSDTYSSVHVDDLCFDGTIVAVNNPGQASGIRIFPNPTTGIMNIEMPYFTQSDISLQIISLTGQQIFGKTAEPGISVQTIDASALPQGMYFLQILSKGQVIAVNKFVKQ